MLVDLHAHYPMQVMPRLRQDTHTQIKPSGRIAPS